MTDAPPEVPSAAWADLELRVANELGRGVHRWQRVAGGTQNRLFRLETGAGESLLAKFYVHDRWDRLNREYSALARLERADVAGVPRSHLRSDAHNYGVYTFEPGAIRLAADLSPREAISVAAFVARLEHVMPSPDEAADLPLAVDSAISLTHHLHTIDLRLRGFEAFASASTAYPEVRDLWREIDLRLTIEELSARVARGLQAPERGETLPRSNWRLNSGDFAPPNILFADNGQLTVVDFEASGWDDPAHLVIDFVAHAASEDMPREAAEAFLAAYADAVRLPPEQIRRFERVGTLCDIAWIAIYASAMTPDTVAVKQFSDAAFDLHAYLAATIDRLKRRVVRASDGTGYKIRAL